MQQNVFYLPDKSGNQRYGKDASGDEVYNTSALAPQELFAVRGGEPYYAKRANKSEYYPSYAGHNVLAITSDGPKYARDALDNEFYPRSVAFGDEVAIMEDGRPIYAKKATGQRFYPKLKNGDEQMFRGWFIHGTDGLLKYPLKKSGDPIYPVENGDETYPISIGKNREGTQVYARKKNGDEYYPKDGTIAHTKDGDLIYAKTKDGKVIFTTDSSGNEMYFMDAFGNDVITDVDRYAQKATGEEYYPLVAVNGVEKREVILNGRYANQNMYPVDEFNNEFTLDLPTQPFDLKKYFPNGYPITNDHFVIVPASNGQPFIDSSLIPPVRDENIVSRLYRQGQGYTDYLTDVHAFRLARVSKKKYDVMSLAANPKPTGNVQKLPTTLKPHNGNSWYMILCVVLGILAVGLCVSLPMFMRLNNISST